MVISEGSTTSTLGEAEVRGVAEKHLHAARLDGRRVLAIIPDHTRSGPTDLFFRVLCEVIGPRAARLDFLVALGTHPKLKDGQMAGLIGMSEAVAVRKYPDIRVFNHAWNDPSALVELGRLSEEKVESLSGGLLRLEVPVLVNRMLLDYDHLLICGPIFPHEVAGFSGGHKYLFPGIAAPQIIDFTHWLGALVTNPVINGDRDTPVRMAIEAAADMVPTDRSLLSYVVEGDHVRGLFAGDVREAWRAATDLSEQLHIVYRDEPYATVLSCAPRMYDDIWTAGKCMYKLEPVVADGGTLIIYAPHIDEVSYSHGRVLDEVGYHVRDFFVRQWEGYRHYPWGVLAHSTHVKGIGRYDNGREEPRVNVVLATQIPQERCRRINLGYMDPGAINVEDYAGREHEGVLCVPKAGETLYRLKDMGRFGGAS